MARELKVLITGDSSSLKKSLGDADKGTKKWSSSLGSLGKTAGIAAGGAAIGGLVVGITSSISAAKDAEEAQLRLEDAMKSANVSYKDNATQIGQVIQAHSKLAAVDDEDLSDSFAKLVRTSGDVKGSLEGMTLATDIAAARGISLEAATKAVEKAMMGSENAFKRVGLEMEKGATSTEILTAAQERFGGAAAKHGQSAAAAQERLSIAFENLQEKIGSKLLPIFADLMTRLSEVVTWVELNWPEIEKTFQNGMDKAKAIFALIRPILQVIVDQIKAIVLLVKAIVDGDWSEVWHQLKQVGLNALKGLWEYVKLWKNTIGAALLELGKFAVQKLEEGLKALPGVMLTALKALPGLIIDMYVKVYTAAFNLGVQVVKGLAEGLAGVAGAVGGAVASAARSALNSVIDAINRALEFTINVPLGPDIHINPPDIPHLAKGGIVRRPTLAMIGEKGPEAVVPLGHGGGGGTNIFNFPNYVGDKRDLERHMQQIMRRFEDSNGVSFTGRSL